MNAEFQKEITKYFFILYALPFATTIVIPSDEEEVSTRNPVAS